MIIPPGSYGLVRTSDWFATCIRKLTKSSVNHAIVFDGTRIIEMNPRGAAYGSLTEYGDVLWFHPPLESTLMFEVSADCLVDLEIGYNFWDIVVQALWLLKIRPQWLANSIMSCHRMVCSQSVDWLYERSGVQLFDDDRLPGFVTPGDLLQLGLEKSWDVK